MPMGTSALPRGRRKGKGERGKGKGERESAFAVPDYGATRRGKGKIRNGRKEKKGGGPRKVYKE